MEFKVDDMVLLKKENLFIPTEGCPVVGTYYEVDGRVIDINRQNIKVRWSNGEQRFFRSHELHRVVHGEEEFYIETKVGALKTFLSGVIPKKSALINQSPISALEKICNSRIYLAPGANYENPNASLKVIMNINQLVSGNLEYKSIW